MKIKKEERHKVTKTQSGKGKEKCSVPVCLCASVPNNRGFTLMELMVVIAIIVLLAGIMVPNLANRIERAKITKAEADIASIEGAIAMYENDTGRYPEDNNPVVSSDTIDILAWRLTGRTSTGIDTNITNDPKWHGPYIRGIEDDPWKNKYRYVNTRDGLLPDVPDNVEIPAVVGTGGIFNPANIGLDYYIYSLGRNKLTGLNYDGDIDGDKNEDDINNWDVNKSWREAK